jgi:hypothetical protein
MVAQSLCWGLDAGVVKATCGVYGRTVCGHYVCEDWFDLFSGHDAMGKEGLEEGAVHVGVALVWRHIANDWRVVSRHDGLTAQLVWIEKRNARVRLGHEAATGTAGKLTRGKHDDARARDHMNPSPARTCSSAPGQFRYIVRASLLA